MAEWTEDDAIEFFENMKKGNIVEVDGAAFVKTELKGGMFGIMFYAGNAPFAVYPFKSTERAIAFANNILDKVKS